MRKLIVMTIRASIWVAIVNTAAFALDVKITLPIFMLLMIASLIDKLLETP